MEILLSAKTVVAESEKPRTFDFKRLGFSIRFVVSGDGLVCNCLYEPSPAGSPITSAELTGFLGEAKIREGIDEEALKIVLSLAEEKNRLRTWLSLPGIRCNKAKMGKLI